MATNDRVAGTASAATSTATGSNRRQRVVAGNIGHVPVDWNRWRFFRLYEEAEATAKDSRIRQDTKVFGVTVSDPIRDVSGAWRRSATGTGFFRTGSCLNTHRSEPRLRDRRVPALRLARRSSRSKSCSRPENPTASSSATIDQMQQNNQARLRNHDHDLPRIRSATPQPAPPSACGTPCSTGKWCGTSRNQPPSQQAPATPATTGCNATSRH